MSNNPNYEWLHDALLKNYFQDETFEINTIKPDKSISYGNTIGGIDPAFKLEYLGRFNMNHADKGFILCCDVNKHGRFYLSFIQDDMTTISVYVTTSMLDATTFRTYDQCKMVMDEIIDNSSDQWSYIITDDFDYDTMRIVEVVAEGKEN